MYALSEDIDSSTEFDILQNKFLKAIEFIERIEKAKTKAEKSTNSLWLKKINLIEYQFYNTFTNLLDEFQKKEAVLIRNIQELSVSVEIENDVIKLCSFMIKIIPYVKELKTVTEQLKFKYDSNEGGISGQLDTSTDEKIIKLYAQKQKILLNINESIKKYAEPYEKEEASFIKSQALNHIVIEQEKTLLNFLNKFATSLMPSRSVAMVALFLIVGFGNLTHGVTKQFQEKLDYIRGYNNIENITKIPTGKEILVPQELLKDEFRNSADSTKYVINKDGVKCFVVKLDPGKGLFSIVRDNIDLTVSLDNIEEEKRELETIKIVVETGKLTVDQQTVLKNIIPLFAKNPHYNRLVNLCGGNANKLYALYMATLNTETGMKQISGELSSAEGIGQIMPDTFKDVKTRIWKNSSELQKAYPEVGKYTWADMSAKNAYANIVVSLIYWTHNMNNMVDFLAQYGQNDIHEAALFNLISYNAGSGVSTGLIYTYFKDKKEKPTINEVLKKLKNDVNKSTKWGKSPLKHYTKYITYKKVGGKTAYLYNDKLNEITNYVKKTDVKYNVFLKILESTVFASK